MKKERLLYFDGLRGLAALIVLTTHISLLFFENVVYKEDIYSIFDKVYVGTPINIISQGNMAVRYFFILSGFLITRKIYGGTKLSKVYIYKHWVRLISLTVPAIFFAYLLLRLDLIKISDFFHQTGLFKAAPKFFINQVDIVSALKEALFDIFIFGKNTYNTPLWTMRAEFWGSILIYYLAHVVLNKPLYQRKYLYLIAYIIVIPINYNIADFVLGALVWDTLSGLEDDNSFLGRLVRSVFTNVYYRRLLYVLGFYLAFINQFGIGLWFPLSPILKLFPVFRPLGVAILFLLLYHSKKLQRFFSHPTLLWLGKLSPYIYIFHWPIFESLGLSFYLSIGISLGLFGKFLTGFVMIVLGIFFAWLYYLVLNLFKKNVRSSL
ncbi:acyltransferase family protein [Streptococcus sp. IMAU 99125]|uniref:Acyltransferase family protein n=1 Tax=Streptococcus humanilactis TaxID=2841061 RepID=A0ABS7DXB2_9STRE|nr:acyltransferase family protein [Streptococcus humanilactis]MBW7580481.1 acyltransferase family protein [Streptococcus humanilactis]MBW7582342.1 acyltransferase family protein [Streptococcus humanilactis]